MSSFRGWLGEKKTTFIMWLSLNSNTYKKFHNLIIPSNNGTSQIDHLVISPFGVFIVETKNYKGWIFGSENQRQWTQTLYKEKYRFQNPLKQTYRQKKVLSKFLDLEEALIHTIVYFVGDCKLKTELPGNVLTGGLARYIKKFRQPVLSNQKIEQLCGALERHRSNSNLNLKDHRRSLRERHNSITACPNCGSELKLRTVRTGKIAGSQFIGCSSYPKCRYSRPL